jgi:hypothetical protein
MVSHWQNRRNAITRMSPPQFGHARGNSSPTRAMSFAQAFARGVMRAGLLMFVTGVAAAFRTVPVTRMPASLDLLSLADVAFSRAP